MNIEKILNSFLNLLYPNVCCLCDKICDDYICPKCKIKLNKIAKFKTNKYNNKYFRKHIYLFKYDGIIKDTLIKYKFREKNYKYKGFVNFLLKNKKICEILKSYDIIIPVPIHRIRKLERGYNQSELLATEIAKSIDGLKCETKILIKKINNKPQSTNGKSERKQNVIGAYYLKNEYKLKNKKVILLDDIFTTGNTVNECCKILRKADIKSVDVITIAKD